MATVKVKKRICSEEMSKNAAMAAYEITIPPVWPFFQTSVLVRAVLHGKPRHVEFLLQKGCNPNKPVSNRRIRPLMLVWIVQNVGKRMFMLRKFIDFHVNPMFTYSEGRNSLMHACVLSLPNEVGWLVKNSYIDFKATDVYGNTVLHFCSLAGTGSVLKIILEKMHRYLLHVNGRNSNNLTALDVAILNGNTECAQELQKAGGQCTLPKFRGINSIRCFLPRLTEQRSSEKMTMTHAVEEITDNKVQVQADIYRRKTSRKAVMKENMVGLTSSSTRSEQKRINPQSPSNFVHRLLSTKGKRSTASYRNPSKRTPLKIVLGN